MSVLQRPTQTVCHLRPPAAAVGARGEISLDSDVQECQFVSARIVERSRGMKGDALVLDLETAASSLREADCFLRASIRNREDRIQLQREAISRVAEARTIVEEAARALEPSDVTEP